MMEKKAKKDKAATGALTPHILGEARKSCSLGAPGLEESLLESSAASLTSARSYEQSMHVVADSSSAGLVVRECASCFDIAGAIDASGLLHCFGDNSCGHSDVLVGWSCEVGTLAA